MCHEYRTIYNSHSSTYPVSELNMNKGTLVYCSWNSRQWQVLLLSMICEPWQISNACLLRLAPPPFPHDKHVLHYRLRWAEKEHLLSVHSVWLCGNCTIQYLKELQLCLHDICHQWRQYISGRKLYSTVNLANTADLIPRLTCSMEQQTV